VAWVPLRTIQTERPPLVSEVSANFCQISRPEPLLFLPSSSSIVPVSALFWAEWWALRSHRFILGERALDWIGGWVNPKAGLDDMEKWKLLTLPRLELRPLGCPPVDSGYTGPCRAGYSTRVMFMLGTSDLHHYIFHLFVLGPPCAPLIRIITEQQAFLLRLRGSMTSKLTEVESLPDGIADAPRCRDDVEEGGVVARRFP
jgi:hypothetical protein